MRKVIVIAMLACFAMTAYGQRKTLREMTERRLTFDLGVTNTLMLNRLFPDEVWYEDSFKRSAFGMNFKMNYRFAEKYGVWMGFDMGNDYSNDYPDREEFNLFQGYIDLGNGYAKYVNGNQAVTGSSFSLGFFRRDWFGRWAVSVYAGWSLYMFAGGNLEFDYKKHGSNERYEVGYFWNKTRYFHGVRLAVEVKWKVWERIGIYVNVGYMQTFDRTQFKARITDWYRGEVIERISVRGRRPDNFTFSFGVSFMGSTRYPFNLLGGRRYR